MFIILFYFSDKNELEAAQHFLEQAASNNHPEFLKALSDILAHAGNSAVSRMAAGLQLKNQLTSKEEATKLTFQAKWLQLSEDIRNYVKKNVRKLYKLLLLIFLFTKINI
jgi:importin subunit beta-1